MKLGKFTEAQIAFVLMQAEDRMSAAAVCRSEVVPSFQTDLHGLVKGIHAEIRVHPV